MLADSDTPPAGGPNLHFLLLIAPGPDAESLSFLLILLPRCAILLYQMSLWYAAHADKPCASYLIHLFIIIHSSIITLSH